MKYVPLKSFLGKPLKLPILSGNVYYEHELDEAIKKYESQFNPKSCRDDALFDAKELVLKMKKMSSDKDYQLAYQNVIDEISGMIKLNQHIDG